MRHFISFVWREHRLIGVVTVTALCTALFFIADFAAEALYFANPANQDRPVETWMSIRYVEESWDLTKPVMFDIIGYDVNADKDDVPHSVGAFLAESGMTLEEFQAQVERAKQMLEERGHK